MSVPARISIVTLGVDDVARSKAFYEALGWELAGVGRRRDLLVPDGGNLSRSLRPGGPREGCRPAIRAEGGVRRDHPRDMPGERGRRRYRLRRSRGRGRRILKPAVRADWGGYSGYVADPDGHPGRSRTTRTSRSARTAGSRSPEPTQTTGAHVALSWAKSTRTGSNSWSRSIHSGTMTVSSEPLRRSSLAYWARRSRSRRSRPGPRARRGRRRSPRSAIDAPACGRASARRGSPSRRRPPRREARSGRRRSRRDRRSGSPPPDGRHRTRPAARRSACPGSEDSRRSGRGGGGSSRRSGRRRWSMPAVARASSSGRRTGW